MFSYKNYSEVRNKIHVKSFADDSGKIDLHIDVKNEILIKNKNYFTRTITKAKQFEEEFNKCYEFLDKAIENNKKILWEFG